MDEKQLTEEFISIINSYFHVLTEQWCDCRKCRFDLVLRCRQSDATFIIEMKKKERKRGAQMAEHVDQANFYRHHKYQGQHYPVLVAPGYSYDQIRAVKAIHPIATSYSIDVHNAEHTHHTFNGYLGHFGVGEVRRRKFSLGDYYMFVFNNLELYSCNPHFRGNTGLHANNYHKTHNELNQWPLLHTLRILQTTSPTLCQSSKPSTASETAPSAIP